MAIKDWEKKGNSFGNKKDERFIWIFDKDHSNDNFRVVVFKNPREALIRKSFKTKSQAIKFAKSFMKSSKIKVRRVK